MGGKWGAHVFFYSYFWCFFEGVAIIIVLKEALAVCLVLRFKKNNPLCCFVLPKSYRSSHVVVIGQVYYPKT